jgi:4'-phosphopantetheinyl transferase EntD
MTDEARKLAPPALEAIRNAPKGDPSLLTDDDRARIAANQEARRLGSKNRFRPSGMRRTPAWPRSWNSTQAIVYGSRGPTSSRHPSGARS